MENPRDYILENLTDKELEKINFDKNLQKLFLKDIGIWRERNHFRGWPITRLNVLRLTILAKPVIKDWNELILNWKKFLSRKMEAKYEI